MYQEKSGNPGAVKKELVSRHERLGSAFVPFIRAIKFPFKSGDSVQLICILSATDENRNS
jgi:hypothetical protein